MKLKTKQKIADSLRAFRLPRYEEIPDVGLFLEQTATYLSESLSPLKDCALTPSMISNYVKKDLVDNPVKKRYGREQIAYLIFIALTKNVLSLDGLSNFIALQKRTYPLPVAYDYFCRQFESILLFTAEARDTLDIVGEDSTDEKRLLFSCIVAVTQKIYLERCLEAISQEEPPCGD